MQPKPFEEWIEKGHQQDANLCSAYERPTDEHSLVRGGEGYNQGSLRRNVVYWNPNGRSSMISCSFVYFAKACGDVEGLCP